MVEIFKTDVQYPQQTIPVLQELQKHYPCYKLNFDLEDCDKILRVETEEPIINIQHVAKLVNQLGYRAEPFPD